MAVSSKRERTLKAVEDASENAKDKVADYADAVGKDMQDAAAKIAASAQESAATVAERLRSVGVDPDVLAGVAKDQASHLQKFIADELKNRPVRALGVAAAVGLIVGIMTAR